VQVDINYFAVFVAAVVYYIGGALWYSPFLFGKTWMDLAGLNEEKIKEDKKSAWKSYLTAAGSALLISIGLTRVEGYLNVITIGGGLHTGFWAWICFVVTTMATNNAFAGRPFKLLLIDSGYHLYGFVIMGIILSVWK
jgi:Protein of unknown function (DUF1761)